MRQMQGEDDAGCLENIIAWLLTKPAKPPQPWNTYRAEEIEVLTHLPSVYTFILDVDFHSLARLAPSR